MSHFTVLVCLPPMPTSEVQNALSAALEPFDENREVEQATDEDGDTYWRNPQAKWDWWTIGGRWRGYFIPAAHAQRDDLIFGEPGVFDNAPKTYIAEGRECPKPDGGRRGSLDLEAMRNEAEAKAAQDWDQYASVVEGTPQHSPWSEYVSRVELAEAVDPVSWEDMVEEARARALAEAGLSSPADIDALAYGAEQYKRYDAAHRDALDSARKRYHASLDYSIDMARSEYAAQPRIAALRKHPEYRNRFDGPENDFEVPRDEYVLRQVARAVPGYATLRADGRWLAPGRMGWFGMSDDDPDSYAYYTREANTYIDALSSDSWLVVVDAHI